MPNIPRLCSDCHESLRPKLSGKGNHIVFSCPTHGHQAIRRTAEAPPPRPADISPAQQRASELWRITDRETDIQLLKQILFLRLFIPGVMGSSLVFAKHMWESAEVTTCAICLFLVGLLATFWPLRWLSHNDARRILHKEPGNRLAKFTLKYT